MTFSFERLRGLLFSVSLFAVSSHSAAAQTACADGAPDADLLIRACTAVIRNPAKALDITSALKIRAAAYRRKSDLDRAIADYTLALSRIPKSETSYADTLTDRGLAYIDKGDLDRAITDFNQAISLDPRHIEALLNRAEILKTRQSHDQAMADYGSAIAVNPLNPLAFYMRGIAFVGQGDLDKAIADLTEAVRLNPKYADAYYWRAKVWEVKGDADRAISDFSDAIRAYSEFPAAYQRRATLLRDKSDFVRSAADFTEAIRIDPKSSVLRADRADTWRLYGDFDRAIADYDEAIRLEPTEADYSYSRGLTRYFLGDYAAASADAAMALKLDPDAYHALLSYLARTRLGENANRQLQDFAKSTQNKAWPYPIIESFVERRDVPADLVPARHRCEAFYFQTQRRIVERAPLVHEDVVKAASEACSEKGVFKIGLEAELSRLGKGKAMVSPDQPARQQVIAQQAQKSEIPRFTSITISDLTVRQTKWWGPRQENVERFEYSASLTVKGNSQGTQFKIPFDLNVCVHQNERFIPEMLLYMRQTYEGEFDCDGVGGGTGNRPANVTQGGKYVTRVSTEGDKLVIAINLTGRVSIAKAEVRGRAGGKESFAADSEHKIEGALTIRIHASGCDIVAAKWQTQQVTKFLSGRNRSELNDYRVGPKSRCKMQLG